MPQFLIDGAWLEIPRHVHKRDGSSRIVADETELRAAVADGWLVDPNAPDGPQEAPQALDEAEAAPAAPDAPSEPAAAPDAPVRRGRRKP